jgi:uncharacterized protein
VLRAAIQKHIRRTARLASEALIARMARRIASEFHPDQVILFGSYARGDADADSDVDLLIVMPVERSKADLEINIGVMLHDFAVPKDIVVSTPEEFAWRKDVVGTIEYPAVREGKVLYVRQ